MIRQEMEQLAKHPLSSTVTEAYVSDDAVFSEMQDVGEFVEQLMQLFDNSSETMEQAGNYLEAILREDPRLAKIGAKTGKAFLKQLDVVDALVDKMRPLAEDLV